MSLEVILVSMYSIRACLALACAAFLICPRSFADVKLANLFGDGMVLQRDGSVKVWGTAAPGENVRVSVAGKSASGAADAAGNWLVELSPEKAGGPYEMVVEGTNQVRLRDVWFGEVWLCSGQSNMQFPLSDAVDGSREIAKLSKLGLHLFQVGEAPSAARSKEIHGSWSICRAEDAHRLSAVAYFFISDLAADLKVPVGLIQSVVGGTPAETWADVETMKEDPALDPSRLRAARKLKSKPGALFNGMIAPLAPYSLRGVIWYQGESNTGFAAQYKLLFPTLIQSWRNAWSRKDLPFLFVQLPGFGEVAKEPGPSDWAELREAQAEALKLPATGMAVAIDVGDADLHPPRKREIGERLARIARSRVYGEKKLVEQGPSFTGMSAGNGALTLRFDHVEGGLKAAKGEKLSGFAVAGEDHRFAWAEARIESDRVIVKSAEVPAPVAVRYGWSDLPTCNLCNGEGLPAAPFRSDDWKDR
jgi:sialate O-acetylesterase